jgi:hypothetical protein
MLFTDNAEETATGLFAGTAEIEDSENLPA